MSAKIHKLDSANNAESSQHKLLIGSIKNCLNEKLSGLLSNMFNSADDALFKLAETAETNEEQTHYFDAMRLLRMERKTINKKFAEALRSYLKPAQIKDNDNDQLEDELSLVDQEEMEEMVAISTMHSKAMNQFGEAVSHLEARLEVLEMKLVSSIDKQALIPKHICEAFQQALTDVELGLKTKLVMYKLFDQEVNANLGDLYKALNQLLIDEGILPQIKLGESKPSAAKSTPVLPTQEAQPSEPQQNPAYNPAQGSNAQATNFHAPSTATSMGYQGTPGSQPQAEVNRVINQFISGEMTASGPGIPSSFSSTASSDGSSSTQYYDRRDILEALSNLQTNFNQQNEVTEFVDAETFKRALLIDMGSRHGGTLTKRVNQVDEKTIDFIEMLFEVIVEDNSISEIVTNLLLRLQIPVIKVAMLDQDFFAEYNHPARKTLNLLAGVGTGIDDKTDETYIKLENIVDQLLEEFDVDILSFQHAADQLNEIIATDLKRTEETEKQTQKQVLQEHARQIVLAELQHMVSGKQLPKSVHPLILKHWSTLMFHCYVRSGKNSNEWNQAVTVLKSLLNSLQPISSVQQWQYLNTNHEFLIENVRDKLYETKQDRQQIDDSLNTLSEIFKLNIEESEFSHQTNAEISNDHFVEFIENTGAFDALPEIESETLEASPIDKQIEEAREKIAQLPSEVRPGTWFELYNGEDNPIRRLKLSVIIMEEAKLVFVDRLGAKVMEKDADSFKTEIEDDVSRIIADHSVFDNALSNVINSLAAAS